MQNKNTNLLTSRLRPERPFKTPFIIGFVIGLIVLLPCLYIAHTDKLTGLQARLFYDVNNIQLSSFFVTVAKIITEGLGAGYAIAACVLIPLVYRRFRLSWLFFFTTGGSTVVFYLIKKIIKEPRPLVLLHGHLHQRVIETGPGFPSGHQTAATALALTLWLIMPNRWRWVPIVWILLVGLSRLYLGVHTPIDLVGGLAVGLMSVCFLQLLPVRISRTLHLNISSEKPLLGKEW